MQGPESDDDVLLTCVECGSTKAATDFHRERSRATGRNRRCKDCRNAINRAHVARDRARRLETMARWRAANPERYSASVRGHKMRRYGLTLEAYEARFAAQSGACAICRQPEAGGWDLAIDHDHATGRVRGLLCRRCNAGIGLLRDDAAILSAAADYLRRGERSG